MRQGVLTALGDARGQGTGFPGPSGLDGLGLDLLAERGRGQSDEDDESGEGFHVDRTMGGNGLNLRNNGHWLFMGFVAPKRLRGEELMGGNKFVAGRPTDAKNGFS